MTRAEASALKVTVDYLGYIKGLIGVTQAEKIELKSEASVRDLLDMLAKKHGDSFRKAIYESGNADLKSSFILSVNGLLLNQLKGLDTKLKEDDQIVLMPIVSGG